VADGQQMSALICATVLDQDFCKVPPQLCDGSTVIHDICSSSSLVWAGGGVWLGARDGAHLTGGMTHLRRGVMV